MLTDKLASTTLGKEATKEHVGSPRILGLLFDVDGTLYHQGLLHAMMAACFAAAFLRRPRRTLRELRTVKNYRRAMEQLRTSRNGGRLSAEAQLRRAAAMGLPLQTVEESVQYWMEQAPLMFLSLCARRALIRTIRRWHRLGVRMGVYSDYPAEDKLRRLGLASVFKTVVCSMDPEVRALKPDPCGLKVAAGKLGVSPRNAVYVGDREEVDGIAAARAGMRVAFVGRRRRSRTCVRAPLTLDALDSHLRESWTSSHQKRCWICSASSTRRFRPSTIGRSITSESVRVSDSAYGQTAALRVCRRCGFVFADELPCSNLVNLYRDMSDPEYLASAPARRVQVRRLLDVALSRHPQARTLLDVGAGIGLLVSEALARGLHAEGVEPSMWCVETAARVNRVKLLCGTLEDCSARLGTYDLVLLVDVVEHTDAPLRLIEKAAEKLAINGRMVIVTLDIGSLAAGLMGRWWWHHRVAHVCYFNRASMRHALKICGLEVLTDITWGWRFPVPYLCKRLARYIPLGPARKLLEAAAHSKSLSRCEIDLNLRDSRTFIATRKGES
ncbi:MAG: HAD-IA family hydrolase [bacterium]|nr:HAD-IA family hydrolase [bacterium]